MQGFLLLNKPKGMTSFSAVSAIKRLAGEKRVGHTGTLDPMATGVLPIFLGRATALSSLVIDAEKKYIADVKLGVVTDTDDITGNVISEKQVDITPEKLAEALERFTGEIEQVPPMYSAIKKDGVRLYKLAREGKTVDLKPRKIKIFEIKLLQGLDGDNIFKIEAHVSKGTYIRSLARDIGEYLGTGATLAGLERSFVSGFSIEETVKLEDLTSENITEFIKSEEYAVEYLPEICVTQKQAVRFTNGGQLGFDRLRLKDVRNGQLYRVKYNGLLLGIGEADCDLAQINIKCIINYPKGE